MKSHTTKERRTANRSMMASPNKSLTGNGNDQVNPATGNNKLANIITGSPVVATQCKLQKAIDSSPRQLKELAKLTNKSASPVQCAPEDEELLQGKLSPLQRQPKLEEEPLQGKFNPTQLMQDTQGKANNTGLPDKLKSGIETLSGIAMDNVRVHYNSAKPAQLNAFAYAQGTNIHIAPGQQQHLPHEAWHVVQQAQGRVKPTMQMNDGVQVNDDTSLEREADIMGAKAKHHS